MKLALWYDTYQKSLHLLDCTNPEKYAGDYKDDIYDVEILALSIPELDRIVGFTFYVGESYLLFLEEYLDIYP